MDNIFELLKPLSARHQKALNWFIKYSGTIQRWPHPLRGNTLLASKAKGIYKPKWTQYALSIRQTLDGPYPDRDPIMRSDGTWVFAYYQENEDPAARDTEYTNRGLMACSRDQVPVGVMRQVTRKPNVQYKILGLALVSKWEEGYFFLEGCSSEGFLYGQESKGEIDFLYAQQEQNLVKEGTFDPNGIIDGRERTLGSIVRRRGQPEFRKKLLTLYEERCAISGCNVVETLEAAHIIPYRGQETNVPSNGLLLRADLHVLFDKGLIAVDPKSHRVLISPRLKNSIYEGLEGTTLRLPQDKIAWPNPEALNIYRHWARL